MITTIDIIQSLTCEDCPACQTWDSFNRTCTENNILNCTKIKLTIRSIYENKKKRKAIKTNKDAKNYINKILKKWKIFFEKHTYLYESLKILMED